MSDYSLSTKKIKEQMAALDFRPKKLFGQNFLVNQASITKIIEVASKLDSELIVEIGPGLGALTEPLSKLGRPLKLIEVDNQLAELWKGKGFDVVLGDALQIDWEKLTQLKSTTLVSNLPYQISSSIVIERSEYPAGTKNMVLMFQKEVAERILSAPRCKPYGLLSVVAQCFWTVELVINLHPQSFFPPPKIASSVLKFEINKDCNLDRSLFIKFIKGCFRNRRKYLTSNIKNYCLTGQVNEKNIHEALDRLNLNHKARAEELTVSNYVDLFLALRGL